MDGWARAIDVTATALEGRSQQSLADAVGVSQTTISNFLRREKLPGHETIFGIERALKLEPGAISRHLGYLPCDAVDVVGIAEAIRADESLTGKQRGTLLDILDNMRGNNERR